MKKLSNKYKLFLLISSVTIVTSLIFATIGLSAYFRTKEISSNIELPVNISLSKPPSLIESKLKIIKDSIKTNYPVVTTTYSDEPYKLNFLATLKKIQPVKFEGF